MKLIYILLIVLLIGACTKQDSSGGENVVKEKQLEQPVAVSLRTDDSQVIKAIFYPNKDSNKGIILIHQFSKNKSSWEKWAPMFQKTHNVLAIDLRGHGESSGNHENFMEEDFINMKFDIKAASDYLQRKNIMPIATSYMGASIGANTVQNYVSENAFDKAILLSPGINYKGIELNTQDNAVLIIVSKEDTYSFNSVKELEQTNTNSEYMYLENKGHGTDMLDEELVQKIINYLNN